MSWLSTSYTGCGRSLAVSSPASLCTSTLTPIMPAGEALLLPISSSCQRRSLCYLPSVACTHCVRSWSGRRNTIFQDVESTRVPVLHVQLRVALRSTARPLVSMSATLKSTLNQADSLLRMIDIARFPNFTVHC